MKGRLRNKNKSGTNIIELLKPYKGMVTLLILFTLLGNGVNLVIPKIISYGIDSFNNGNYIFRTIFIAFISASVLIFIFTYLQNIVQVYASERVAFDLRKKLSDKISRQSYSFIQKSNPSKILTNLTSDMDSLKMFVSMAVSSIVSSVFVIIGTCILLLTINWKLALPVIIIIPVIAFIFIAILRKVRFLFKRAREVIDWLNKIINESILGSAIIRVLNSQYLEYKKFISANTEAKEIGISVLTLFAVLIPAVTFVANMAILSILALGGHFVINNSLSLGDFAAFNSYVSIIVFPLIIIGFMSNVIAQSTASYERIKSILDEPEITEKGIYIKPLTGKTELKNINVSYNGKPALKNVSFSIEPGSRTAIIGPTAAGKSQLLYLLTGLIKPDSGDVLFDGISFNDFKKDNFYQQIGIVLQDSVMFNLTLRENIAFNDTVTDEYLNKAVETAELKELIDSLPDKLDTIVSERGTTLSGGQKQRVMLARALALNPKILLLDDFTARVDNQTEQTILCNIMNNYPHLTLVSVTQKIAPVKHFEQIILIMEGEIIATGKHKELMDISPEYVQIYKSQLSTNHYELQS